MNNIAMDMLGQLANNSVVIQSDRAVKNEDLKFLYLYFQMEKYSGGGEMASFNYDEDKQRIYIKYLHDGIKQKVLKRKRLSCLHYNFQSLDLQEKTFVSVKNDRSLIVKNLKKTSCAIGIHLYLDYLTEQGSVISTRFSNIFESTLYVEFRDDINFARLKQKLVKIPDFDGQKIEIFEAFNTNKIILELNQEKSQNDLWRYLIQNFTIENGCCYDSSPFCVVVFENNFKAMKCLESKTFDADFVKSFEASWNDTLTNQFIAKCMRKNNRKSSTKDTINGFIGHPDNLTLSVSMLNSSLPNNFENKTQQRKLTKVNRSSLQTSRDVPVLLKAKAQPSNKQNSESASLIKIQSSASSSNVCHASSENDRELDDAQPTSSNAMFKGTSSTQRRDNEDCEIIDDLEYQEASRTNQTTNLSSKSVSESSFEKDGLEIIENCDGNDDGLKRRKSFLFRYKCNRTQGSFRFFLYCKICPFRGTTKANLEKHCRGHSVITPFKCTFCNYYGTTKKATQSHQRMHKKLAFAKDVKMEK